MMTTMERGAARRCGNGGDRVARLLHARPRQHRHPRVVSRLRMPWHATAGLKFTCERPSGSGMEKNLPLSRFNSDWRQQGLRAYTHTRIYRVDEKATQGITTTATRAGRWVTWYVRVCASVRKLRQQQICTFQNVDCSL
jgi:hypothetical protein